MNHARLDQLSDGIFAIVMTILVFQIKLPAIWGPIDNADLWLEIQKLIPLFLSYALSFALLFTYWRAHHFFVTIYAKNVDSMLININALFFMLISLVPFSASILGQFSNNELSVIIFGIHIILIGLTLYWMRRYVIYSPHIQNPEMSEREIRGSTVRTLAPVVFAIIAIPLSFLSIKFSLVLFTLAVIFNLSSYSTRISEKFLVAAEKK
ncbi:MAG TPA: TMEM175 family protein [Candidatus Paceibacterota bacterium]|nr:TMEM175 family protein [Candidatus Paceibacterota bacterium]